MHPAGPAVYGEEYGEYARCRERESAHEQRRARASRSSDRRWRSKRAQLAKQRLGRGGTIGGIERKTARHEMHQLGRCGRTVRRQRWRLLRKFVPHDLLPPARERGRPREHLEQQGADGVNVRAMVRAAIADGLLGGHVGGRSQRSAFDGERLGSARIPDGLGNAEVRDDGVVSREQHVVRLDVAMHDTLRVCVHQRLGHVHRHAECLGDRHGTARGQPATQRLAGSDRHHVVQQLAVRGPA